ncbi:MAG: ATP-binding protein [Erysipelotrichaceae bacterium]|nr:ATP-binding protein [Erysipelotrichaceae bacterium]
MIGEYIDIPSKITDLLQVDDKVHCLLSIYINDSEICRYAYSYCYKEHSLYSFDDMRFNVDVCAWSPGIQGFGREDEIRYLKKAMDTNGITMIYGSSRIGKSSLLTYLKEEYAYEYYKHHDESLMVISLCDATNLTYYQDLKYESDEDILQFLFVDSIYKGLHERDRSKLLGHEFQINDTSNQMRIVTKLQMISQQLATQNVQIWVLIDEFQQLIDKWTIRDDKIDNWKEVNNYLKTISNIKFVLCGSDAIVKAIKNQSISWHKVIIDYKPKAIMQLNQTGFTQMIQDHQVWNDNPCPFVDSAIDYLYDYVSGNATYGKLLANMIIDSGVLAKREHVFSYDVFKAASMMLEDQNDELNHMQSTQTMILQVTKNLEDEEKYLQYIAKMLETNPNRMGVLKAEIERDFAYTYEHHKDVIETALEICQTRGIIKLVDDKYYTFTTPFYYYCYSHNARNLDLNDLIETKNDNEVEETELVSVKTAFDVMLRQFNYLSYDEQLTYLSSLNAKADKAVKDKLFEDKGPTININAQSSHGMTINAQNISHTYNSILTGMKGDELLKAYKSIPQFYNYVTDDTLKQIETLKDNNEELEELLEQPLNDVYEANKQALILTEDNFNVWETLGISKRHYDELISDIDPQFITDIYLGAKLDNIYSKMDDENIVKDYSPVAIMYCKVVEKMLKFYHTHIYVDVFPDMSTMFKKTGRIKYKFGELIDPEVYHKVQKRLMLGTYLTPIQSQKNIKKLSTYSDHLDIDEDELAYIWKSHAKSLDEVRIIRNASAHGESGEIISLDTLKKLKQVLFNQKRLLKLVQLSHYYEDE